LIVLDVGTDIGAPNWYWSDGYLGMEARSGAPVRPLEMVDWQGATSALAAWPGWGECSPVILTFDSPVNAIGFNVYELSSHGEHALLTVEYETGEEETFNLGQDPESTNNTPLFVGAANLSVGIVSVTFDRSSSADGFAIDEISIGMASRTLLTVRSASDIGPIQGVAISGDRPGTTDYTAFCMEGQVVTLSAPPDPVIIQGRRYSFVRWTGYPDGQRQVTVSMDDDKTVVAEYEAWKHTLYVKSVPSDQLVIAGDKPGTTDYDTGKTCIDQESVSLAAPGTITVGGQTWYFHFWTVDGKAMSPGVSSVLVAMDADHTATAVYGYTIPADVNGDCTVNILDLIVVRNKLGTKCSQ